tara:strand:+ start:1410 stop:1763 length:354 start_codon:yes stop_codon:yes gene_type:complete
MMRIIVATHGCPVEGFEIDINNDCRCALDCVTKAFETLGIEFGTEQQINGTYVQSIGYQQSTEDWFWNIATEDLEGVVNSSEVGIDEIDLQDKSAIFFIATPTICSNNTQYGDDRTC